MIEVSTGSTTSVVTLTPIAAMTADRAMTMAMSPRKIIAGCGTLLPTRSIQPRKPPGSTGRSGPAHAERIAINAGGVGFQRNPTPRHPTVASAGRCSA